MNKLIKLCGLLGAMLLSAGVYAGDIQVEAASARATAPGQDVAMVDFAITSAKEAKLVGFSSPACKTPELHSMTNDKNGVMIMRQAQSLDLPAGKRVSLGASGYHLMLIGLNAPLKAGDSLPLTLNIKVGNKPVIKVEVKAEVKPLTATAPQPVEPTHDMHNMHDMHHMKM